MIGLGWAREAYKEWRKVLRVAKAAAQVKAVSSKVSRGDALAGHVVVFNAVRPFKIILDREAFMGKLCALSGADVHVLLDDGVMVHWDTVQADPKRGWSPSASAGLNLWRWTDLRYAPVRLARRAMERLEKGAYADPHLRYHAYSELLRGVRRLDTRGLEKFARESTVRFFRNSELDLSKSPYVEYYRLSLQNAATSRAVGLAVLHQLHPTWFVTSHGIYSTWGPAFEFLREAGVKCLVYAGQHSHALDRRAIYVTDTSVQTLSRSKYWKAFRDRPVTPQMERAVDVFFSRRFGHSTKDTSVYFQDTKPLTVDPSPKFKYHVAVFPNSIWDGNVEDRHVAFPGIMDWLEETVRFFASRPHVKLYLRFHPAEVTFFKDSTRVGDILRERLPGLDSMENVRLIEPEERVDTYQFLKSGVDLGVLYDGVLGLELPYMGIPALLAGGGGRFSVEGGNFTVRSRQEYFAYLEDLEGTIRRFKENYATFRENVIRYTYWYVFHNPFPLPTLAGSSTDKYATDPSRLRPEDLEVPARLLSVLTWDEQSPI
ncbi:MAG: hypothetical protein Kow0069_16730 [Promethearchaeota archaeon]